MLPPELQPDPSPTADTVSLPLYEAHVAGFAYYIGPQLIDVLPLGAPLDLVREPDNPHDKRAITVYWDGQKLGFLPMRDNPLLATMIDAGVPLTAAVLAVKPYAPPWEMCRLGVCLLYPREQLGPAAPQPIGPAMPEARPRPDDSPPPRPTLPTLLRDLPQPNDPDYVWYIWVGDLRRAIGDASGMPGAIQELISGLVNAVPQHPRERAAFTEHPTFWLKGDINAPIWVLLEALSDAP